LCPLPTLEIRGIVMPSFSFFLLNPNTPPRQRNK
jgi:hypothetical protein